MNNNNLATIKSLCQLEPRTMKKRLESISRWGSTDYGICTVVPCPSTFLLLYTLYYIILSLYLTDRLTWYIDTHPYEIRFIAYKQEKLSVNRLPHNLSQYMTHFFSLALPKFNNNIDLAEIPCVIPPIKTNHLVKYDILSKLPT